MNFLTARTRMTFGLVCMLVTALCTAMMIGLVPERESAILRGRAQLCETIAMCGSDYIARGEQRRLEQLIKSIVERNDDLLSAGVRQANGLLIADIGNHAQSWSEGTTDRSTESNVHVPIRSGKDRWGSIELRFRPVENLEAGWFSNSLIRLTAFVTAVCYLLFFFYLGKMLQYLDPSKTVPKRVREALDSLAEGLLVIDSKQRIVLANQAIAAWIGRDPEKLIGVNAAKLNWVANEQHEPLNSYPWVEAIEREAPQAGVLLGLARDGQPIRILIANASPVLGHDGKYRGVLVSFDDVTSLEETKRELRVAKRAADDANQAKSQFLACMSHEIRTPMNAILGYTDVLRRGFDENVHERQEYLNTIHASGEHLLSLINDILDLSKIESGRMELELQRCSPHQLIMQVITLLRSKSDEKGISLDFQCDGQIPESILADPVRLRQAIMNLASNSIKFTQTGGVRIVARLIAGKSDDHEPRPLFAIDVIDTGIGISKENQSRVFDPFSQADASITRRFGGTGLGLAISRQLATAMGGGLTVESELGRGSTFTITIDPGPLDDVPLVDFKSGVSQVAGSLKQNKELIQLPPARVLVADDGESNRKLLQVVLRRAGVEVVLVENGQLAVEAAIRSDFDVILMDMQMPVMDGYTAATTLRDAGYQQPIIALTAHAMQGSEEQCLTAGCSGYLTKPINIDRLLAMLAEVLGNSSNPGKVDYAAHQPTAHLPPPSSETCSVENMNSSTPLANGGPANGGPANGGPIECSFSLEDPDFLEIAEEFVLRLNEKLVAMRDASSRGDARELQILAHWLKGAGGTAGFDAFTEPACKLETAARSLAREQWDVLICQVADMASRIRLTPNHNLCFS